MPAHDTPKTDAAFIGDPSVGVLPEIITWEDALEFCRHLEKEAKRLQLLVDNKLALANDLRIELNRYRSVVADLEKAWEANTKKDKERIAQLERQIEDLRNEQA